MQAVRESFLTPLRKIARITSSKDYGRLVHKICILYAGYTASTLLQVHAQPVLLLSPCPFVQYNTIRLLWHQSQFKPEINECRGAADIMSLSISRLKPFPAVGSLTCISRRFSKSLRFPASIAAMGITASRPRPVPPLQFPTSGFELIDPSDKVEEEALPTFRPDDYYPMRHGDIIRQRYQVVAKLGYGTTATIWLARDLTWVL